MYPFRFRVTHHDKKLPGGPNPLVSSGDQLDQSQDSEEQKESGYNLRSMFKDVRPPLESSNGVAPNVGKRRKSLIIFGRRRGSDPSGVKVGEGTGREPGGVRFAVEQQPVVLEETSQTENTKMAPECGTKPGLKPETESSKNQVPASPQHEVNTLSSANSSPSQKKIQTHDSISATEESSNQHGPKAELWTNPTIKATIGSPATCAPSSLPIPSTASSGQAFRSAEKDPGPLQTSTPIDRMHGAILGFAPVIPTGQTAPFSTGFPVTQTPPDSGPDLEPGFGASLALISLGSSPPSLSKTKTASSVSSLITPTSPLSVEPSPKLSSKNMPSEATKTQLTPTPPPISSALTPGSKLDTTPGSPQTPTSPAEHLSIGNSPRLTLKSESLMPVMSMNKGDEGSSPKIPKTEKKRVGILKTANLSPVEGDLKASSLSAPTDQLCKDRLSNMPLSPPSPTGSKVSNVTIIKASPNSTREFSVAIMVEKEESSTSTKDQKGVTSELGIESEKALVVSQTVSGVGQSESQHEDNSGKQDRPTVNQKKEDMVEMEEEKTVDEQTENTSDQAGLEFKLRSENP